MQLSGNRAAGLNTPVGSSNSAKREGSSAKPPHSRGLDRPSHWGSSTKYNRTDVKQPSKHEKSDLRATPLSMSRVPDSFSQAKTRSSSITPSPLNISFKPSWIKSESPADDPFERHVTQRREPEVDVIDSTDFEPSMVQSTLGEATNDDAREFGTEPGSPIHFGFAELDALESKRRSGKKHSSRKRFGALWARVCRAESGNSTMWSALAGNDLADLPLQKFDLRDPRCVAKEAVDITIIRRLISEEAKQLPDFDIFFVRIERFLQRIDNTATYISTGNPHPSLEIGSIVLCFFTKATSSRLVDRSGVRVPNSIDARLRIYDFQILNVDTKIGNPFETLSEGNTERDNSSQFQGRIPYYNIAKANAAGISTQNNALSIVLCTNVFHRVSNTS